MAGIIRLPVWIFLSATAFAQMPPFGTLQVEITPKEINPGDSVWFEAGRFNACLGMYSSTYVIERTTVHPPDSFQVVVTSKPAHDQCATAYGFSGPQLHIVALQAGHYSIRFDSLSQWKADMGDSAFFTATAGAAIKKAMPEGMGVAKEESWRIDGRKLPSRKSIQTRRKPWPKLKFTD